MNERIKEFAEQADIFYHKQYDLGFKVENEKELQKFAELIIKECGLLADNYTFDSEGVTFEIYDHFIKHFGIVDKV